MHRRQAHMLLFSVMVADSYEHQKCAQFLAFSIYLVKRSPTQYCYPFDDLKDRKTREKKFFPTTNRLFGPSAKNNASHSDTTIYYTCTQTEPNTLSIVRFNLIVQTKPHHSTQTEAPRRLIRGFLGHTSCGYHSNTPNVQYIPVSQKVDVFKSGHQRRRSQQRKRRYSQHLLVSVITLIKSLATVHRSENIQSSISDFWKDCSQIKYIVCFFTLVKRRRFLT